MLRRTVTTLRAHTVPLQVEHIVSRARGGTDRVSNLALACEPCNRNKGTQDIQEFLSHDEQRLARILAQAQAPLKDATAVNATRWELFRRLQATGLPVETGSGGRTKYNRVSRGLSKTHWVDAACIGASTPESLRISDVFPLLIQARGMADARCATPTLWAFRPAIASGASATLATRSAIWCGRWFPSDSSARGRMWDESRSKRRGPLPSRPRTGKSRMSPTAIVGLCSAAMAMLIIQERGFPRPQAARKERLWLPPPSRRG
jgi:hypothetical protein